MAVSDGDYLKTTFEVTLDDGTIAQNVYYHRANLLVPLPDSSALAFIEVWIEACYANLSAELVNTITQNLCTVQEIAWNAVESMWKVSRLVGYFTPTITFNNATEALPNQSSAFATFLTDRPRSFGRKSLMPFGEDRQAATYLISAALTAMADYADDVITSIPIAALEYLVPGVPREAVEVFLDFTGAVVTNVLGSQRRRRPGVGA